jgi:cytidyltransferase-like protein
MTDSSGLTEQQQGQGQHPVKHEVKVFVSGCYDILHGGHLEFWSQARALGTYLIVSFASDDVLAAHKSSRRSSIPTEHKKQLIGKPQAAAEGLIHKYNDNNQASGSLSSFCNQSRATQRAWATSPFPATVLTSLFAAYMPAQFQWR